MFLTQVNGMVLPFLLFPFLFSFFNSVLFVDLSLYTLSLLCLLLMYVEGPLYWIIVFVLYEAPAHSPRGAPGLPDMMLWQTFFVVF
jgi:hypothetical protein